MSALADLQAAFMRAVMDDEAPKPENWGTHQTAGLAVYRGNYRSALIGAIKGTFERTARLLGASAFKQAAINHAIARPPSGWTIDEAGKDFDATCAELFPDNQEAVDLAWLEWVMLEISTAPDCDPLGPADFATETGDFVDEDWLALRLDFQPRLETRITGTNLAALWKATEADFDGGSPEPRLAMERGCIVSREGERPAFQMVDPDNARSLAAMQSGASYADVIVLLAGHEPTPDHVQEAAIRAGAMLGEWLRDGLVVAIRR